MSSALDTNVARRRRPGTGRRPPGSHRMASAPLARLVGHELDTVSFVRDDIELRIDHSIVRVLTEPSGISGGDPWRLSDECGADILRRYIGLSVVAADVIEDDRISLVFDTGERQSTSLVRSTVAAEFDGRRSFHSASSKRHAGRPPLLRAVFT
jgi:hypothetical protein